MLSPTENKPIRTAAPGAGPSRRVRSAILGGGLLVLVLGSYWYFNSRTGSGADKRNNAAPVRVAVIEQRDMAVVERSLGTVIANTLVQLSARVQGTLESAQFKEGQFVKKGDVLFQIDPRPFQAALAQAEAIWRRDQAQLKNALRDKQRYATLREQGAISTQQSDLSDTNADVVAANVAADKAAVDMARLNLGYAQIRSPVDGKTGPILLQPGNMISSSNGATAPLVTIAEVRPIKVSFTLPQSELPRIQARQQTQPLLATLDVRDKSGRVLEAPVDFTSNSVSNQSGTIELRATFPNADLSLVPGQLVNVTVQLSDIPHALVVPRDAVNDSPSGSFVFAVRDGKAFQTPVDVLTDDGTNAAIAGSGIKAGDTVVVEGQLRVTAGGPVRVLGAKGAAAHKPARHKP
ncbi:MAG: efflux RND transporter periplasmic adaptor subunit [Alphaproteobacteria bacterium]|nr:efflux RND transporter periplasmic adaptor subunit [Alphaproteobacteria bacterium]